MIQYTYSKDYPKIQRLQGGILVPVNIEQVELSGEDGPEMQYRYKLLKFEDHGEYLSAKDFIARHQKIIDRYLADGVDVQRESAKEPNWMYKNSGKIRAHVDLRQDAAKDVPVKRRER